MSTRPRRSATRRASISSLQMRTENAPHGDLTTVRRTLLDGLEETTWAASIFRAATPPRVLADALSTARLRPKRMAREAPRTPDCSREMPRVVQVFEAGYKTELSEPNDMVRYVRNHCRGQRKLRQHQNRRRLPSCHAGRLLRPEQRREGDPTSAAARCRARARCASRRLPTRRS